MKTIDLNSPQGNAFTVIGIVQGAMRKANFTEKQIMEFIELTMNMRYNDLIKYCKQKLDEEINPALDEEDQVVIMQSDQYHF